MSEQVLPVFEAHARSPETPLASANFWLGSYAICKLTAEKKYEPRRHPE